MKDLYYGHRNFVLGIKMEQSEIAKIIFDRVVDYCTRHNDEPLACMADHEPDQLSVFIDSYLKDEEDEAIENSDEKFWRAIEKEYKKLWKEWWSEELAYNLGHLILESKVERIM